MYYRVERKYAEQVEGLIKSAVTKTTSSCYEAIQTRIQDRFRELSTTKGKENALETAGKLDLKFAPGIHVQFKVKLCADGTPEKTSDGSFVLEDFAVYGRALHFLAFCFEEGELFHNQRCKSCKLYSYCRSRTSLFTSSTSTEGHETGESTWRRYMERKYNLLAAELDFRDTYDDSLYERLLNFLWENDILITGGLVFTDCVGVDTEVSASLRTVHSSK